MKLLAEMVNLTHKCVYLTMQVHLGGKNNCTHMLSGFICVRLSDRNHQELSLRWHMHILKAAVVKSASKLLAFVTTA